MLRSAQASRTAAVQCTAPAEPPSFSCCADGGCAATGATRGSDTAQAHLTPAHTIAKQSGRHVPNLLR
eukprot:293391-Prymnesium_polylepis.1